MSKIYVFICAMVLISCGNDTESNEGQMPLPEHTILLEKISDNQAWGFFFESIFVTADGKVRVYKAENIQYEDLVWNYEDMNHSISWDEAKANLLIATEVIGEIGSDDLSRLIRLGSNVEEELANPTYLCDDAGKNIVWIYNVNAQHNQYQKVLVRQCGDEAIANEDDSVVPFLEEFDRLVLQGEFDRLCCFK